MKKKMYIKPRTDRIISYGAYHLLAGSEITEPDSEITEPDPFEPAAKKNIWSSDEDAAEEQYGFRRVGGSTKSLWED